MEIADGFLFLSTENKISGDVDEGDCRALVGLSADGFLGSVLDIGDRHGGGRSVLVGQGCGGGEDNGEAAGARRTGQQRAEASATGRAWVDGDSRHWQRHRTAAERLTLIAYVTQTRSPAPSLRRVYAARRRRTAPRTT